MKLLCSLLLLPVLAIAAPTTPNKTTTEMLTSTVLKRTQFVASAQDWQIETDALDEDDDPEFELERADRIELSINETGTIPLITIDANDAVDEYISTMKTTLKAESRPWPNELQKPNNASCAAYVIKMFAQPNEELALDLVCYLPYRGGTAIVSAEISPQATDIDRKHLSSVLSSIQIN